MTTASECNAVDKTCHIDVSGASFVGDVEIQLRNALVVGDALFQGVEFSGSNVTFDGAKFSGYAHEQSAVYNGELFSFFGCTFEDNDLRKDEYDTEGASALVQTVDEVSMSDCVFRNNSGVVLCSVGLVARDLVFVGTGQKILVS